MSKATIRRLHSNALARLDRAISAAYSVVEANDVSLRDCLARSDVAVRAEYAAAVDALAAIESSAISAGHAARGYFGAGLVWSSR